MSDLARTPLVLVADDDAGFRMVLQELLTAGGFDVVEAVDGPGAVEAFGVSRPDAVVLDVNMPGFDGFEVCARIRARPDGVLTPILVMTGLDDAAAVDRAYEAGATDFAAKPLRGTLLCRRLRYLLRAAQSMAALARSESRLALAQRLARLGFWERDLETGALAWSAEMYGIVGTDPASFRPSWAAYLELLHPQDRAALARAAEDAVQRGSAYGIDLRIRRPDGTTRFVREQGESVPAGQDGPPQLVGTLQDVSLVFYDITTGLPNLKLFRDRLEIAVAQSRRSGQPLALLVADLDRFRGVDGALGREAADRVLAQIARRIESCARPGDTVARIGGDEFAILMPGLGSPEQAAEMALRAMEAVKQPIPAGDREVFVTATVGIGLFPRDGDDAETLLANATSATYAAKEKGQESLRRYTSRLSEKDVQRVRIESGLRRALDRGELTVHYQPIVSLATGRVEHLEALLRWQRPGDGLVPPGEYLPLVETSGLMVAIDSWVLGTACAELAALGPLAADVGVAVNLSARRLQQPDLAENVTSVLAASGLPSGRLGIEVTESSAMQDVDRSVDTLRTLRQLGVRVSVDDFGTGYSSLSYLQRLPIDVVKLDRAFVCNIETNHDDDAIASAVIAMAHSLKLTVVAEGVETAGQLDHLRRLGCDAVQGFLCSPAVPIDRVAGLLAGSALLPALP